MTKIFEDYFSELQADMVAICLEYVNRIADRIYIYSSCEEGLVSCNYFFCINGKIARKHKLNECGTTKYDTSAERQDMVLHVLTEDTKKMLFLCEEYKRPMPTELKLVYDVKTNYLEANYQYGLIHSHDPKRTPRMVAEEWFAQIELEITA